MSVIVPRFTAKRAKRAKNLKVLLGGLSALCGKDLSLIRFELIFGVLRLTGMTASDPGTQVFELDDDAEDSLRLAAMTANGGGITGVVSQKCAEEFGGQFPVILAEQVFSPVVANDRAGDR